MKTTFAGHPLHPQLIAFPVALFPTSLVFDILQYVTKDKSYGAAAYRSMMAGYLGAMAAAGSGAVDYLAIPSGTDSKKVANMHLLMNVGILNLYSLNLLSRRKATGRRPQRGPFLMSVVGNLALFVSGWLGGHLVYRHRLRVNGVSPIESAKDIKMPGDEILERMLERLGASAPEAVEQKQQQPPMAA